MLGCPELGTYYSPFSHQMTRQLLQGPINIITFFIVFSYIPYEFLLYSKIEVKKTKVHNSNDTSERTCNQTFYKRV